MSCWIESANSPHCNFPLQNLPFGVFSRSGEAARCCTAIGDFVLDLSGLEEKGYISAGSDKSVFARPTLKRFMMLGPSIWKTIREQLTDLLTAGENCNLRNDNAARSAFLIPLHEVIMHMPFQVAGFTDFYAGKQHAINVGTMFRGPENALPPNWLHIPIGYNGRASTVVVSGTDVRRPYGQLKSPDKEVPIFSPSRRLDLELEMGAVVGVSNEMGQRISVLEADDMIFGYVLLNDWSARDMQAWEYQPLGPFQAKAFATSISPWIVTKAALEPFRTDTPNREKELLPYLKEPRGMLYDINLEVHMQPEGASEKSVISRTNSNQLYYSSAQQLAHHASSGCRMEVGDLLGTGTISGPEKTEFGSLLELTWGGKEPITLQTGEERTFIEDGDTLTLTGWAQGDGYRIGFGQCTGKVLPAVPLEN